MIKKDSCEEKKKKLKEKHREKVSVIEENSVPECKSPLSDAPNAVLSYLQLMPMPVVDEERGGELLEHSDETLYPSNLTRSDSLETVALALDDRDEEAAQICPLKTSRIECVDLISPGSSPKDDTANTPLSDAFNQVNDVPSKVMLPSAGAHESELLTEFIASSNGIFFT